MARCAGNSHRIDRHAGAVFAAVGRLLLAANKRRRRRSTQAGGLLKTGVEMSTEVVMPQMGESIAKGTITKWLKQVGERVERDEPLFEISTDKVDSVIPAPAAGFLSEIKVAEGTTVDINTVVAVIDAQAGGAAASAPVPAPAAAP